MLAPLAPADRIIPARAGFTNREGTSYVIWRDHPRSRGVYWGRLPPAPIVLGSSPLARGLRRLSIKPMRCSGIIPARAGFTASPSAAPGSASDHPRSRGVYNRAPGNRSRTVGSSPLARGLHFVAAEPEIDYGIIPARAGFTPRMVEVHQPGADHPRSRGVYGVCGWAGGCAVGSSPLARGLRLDRGGWRVEVRDHPRSRGVYEMQARYLAGALGSSPLARGLR